MEQNQGKLDGDGGDIPTSRAPVQILQQEGGAGSRITGH